VELRDRQDASLPLPHTVSTIRLPVPSFLFASGHKVLLCALPRLWANRCVNHLVCGVSE
jgi:hypothetical protein